MAHRRLRVHPHHALGVLILLTFVLSGGVALIGGQLPTVTAQIDNNQPAQPFASVVNCIRSGADLGQSSQASPRFATTCFGTKISQGGYGSTADANDADPADTAVLDFGDAKPDGSGDLYGAPSHTPDASLAQVGTVYGLAYASGTNPSAPAFAQQKRLFTGAFTKLQTRFGSGGPGAIYLINRSTGAVALYAQVPAVVPGPAAAQPGPAGFPNTPGDGSRATFWNAGYEPVYTPESGGIHKKIGDEYTNGNGQPFAAVGKTGLGDIDLDAQERYLYAVNLNTRRVYRFDTWSANPQSTMTILPPLPLANTSCTSSGASTPQDFRPFGLAITAQSLYLGFVCSAEASQNRSADLAAGVSRFDLASNAWDSSSAVSFGLAAYDTQRTPAGATGAPWFPWRNGTASFTAGHVEIYPQPQLSDIAFDEMGNMLLGLRDRFGDMMSDRPYTLQGRPAGDLLFAPPSGTRYKWLAPSTGAEHYIDDSRITADTDAEATNGGLAYVPGTHGGGYGGEVASTYLDPYNVQSFGAAWWNVSGGAAQAYEEIYAGPLGSHVFGKAAGLGDLELLCAWRAIGDRVWRDTNGNGIQDAGEADITGVRLQLFAATDTTFSTPLATVTTGSVAGMSGNWRFYVSPFQAYRVRIDPSMFNAGQPLAGLGLTAANVGGNDTLDSDANAQGAIDIPSAGNGDVNVSFDAGVATRANVTITKTAPASAPVNGSLVYSLTYSNSGPSSAANVTVVDTLPSGVTYVSATPAPSSRSGQTLTWNLGTLAAGANGTISITTTVNNNAPTSVTNRATISTTTTETNTGDNTSTATTTITRPNVTITKSGPSSAVMGSSFAYTLAYRNNGAASAANVQVVDTLPAGLTFVSATPAPASVSGQTLRWNLGTLAAGANGSITVNVTVATSAPANVTNVATISTTTSETNPNDNTGTATTAITRPEVSVDKSGPAVAAVGSSFAYTLAYRNTGTAAAANVQLVDTLPAGLTFVSATPAPSNVSGQALTWNLGTLAAGTNGSITVNVSVNAGAPASVTNSVTISTTTPGDSSGNNTDTVTTSIPRSGVYIGKNGPAIRTVGDTFTYTLSYGNNGGAAADNVTIVDTLPAELVFVSAVPAPTSVSGQSLTWDLGTLPASATGTISVQVRSLSSAADGTVVVNTATISTSTPGDDPSDNSGSASTTLQRADVQIVKTSPMTFPLLSGQPITYYLDYSNAGPAAAANVVLDDTVPPQLTNVRWACDSGCTASGTGNSISINVGTLAAGDGGRVTVIGIAITSAGREDFTNSAAISSGTPETDTTNNQSSVDGAVWTADVQILKAAQAQVIAGETFTATLSYANNGPALALGAILTDTLPAGVALVAAAPAPSSVSGQVHVWNLGDLAAGDGGVITLTLQSDAALPDQSIVTNQARIGTPTVDRDGTNDQSSAQTRVLAQANLAVLKTGPATVVAGSVIQYTLTYTNAGPSLARSALIVDTLPAALVFTSAAPAPSSVSGQVLVWSLGDLAPGASGTITVQANSTTSQSQAATLVVNTAQISSPTPDPDSSDNTSSVPTIVQKPDLSVVKSDGRAQVQPGDTLAYMLTIRNTGPVTATGVVLTDTLPPGLTPQGGGWTPAGGNVYAQAIGTVGPGALVTRTMSVVLPNPLPASLRTAIVNGASVGDDGSAGPDPTPQDNSTTDTDTPLLGRIGDYVWRDSDGDGQQDPSERGLAGVVVQLIDPTTGTILASATTDANGRYQIDGLRMGQYQVRLDPTTTRSGPYKDYRQTTNPQPVGAISSSAPSNLTFDFGLTSQSPTAVVLAYFFVERDSPPFIVRWGTLAERDTALFRVLRATTPDRSKAVMVGALPSVGSQGGDYRLVDAGAPSSGPLYYWLVEVEWNGDETVYGPAQPQTQAVPQPVYLPLVRR